MKRYLVDTNILLRFLSGEPARQAEATRILFTRAAAGEVVLEISPVVVSEAIYTLISFYEVDRKTAAAKLLAVLRSRGVKLKESAEVIGALERLQTTNVGFADAYLAACSAEEQVEIASFDRDLDKFKDIKRFEPGGH